MIVANIMTFGRTYDTRSFEFSIKTDNLSAGSSTATQFRLPFNSFDFVPFNITWGDGSFNIITNFDDPNLLHQYPTAGTYNVKCSGVVGGLQFANTGDRLKLLVISKVDGLNISVSQTFRGCSNMTWIANDTPFISTLSLLGTFRACSSFDGNISSWNTQNVTNMEEMFRNATIFNQNIGNWNTSNVTVMNNMFAVTSSFNQNIGNWNVGNLLSMGGMFTQATKFNQNIGNWNVSNVTNMTALFSAATLFNQNIGNWNVSNVTSFASFMAGKTASNFSAANLDAIYNGWSSRPVKTLIEINFNTIKYTAASSAGRAILTDAPNNWAITDGGI